MRHEDSGGGLAAARKTAVDCSMVAAGRGCRASLAAWPQCDLIKKSSSSSLHNRLTIREIDCGDGLFFSILSSVESDVFICEGSTIKTFLLLSSLALEQQPVRAVRR